jgi:hypothetical protein
MAILTVAPRVQGGRPLINDDAGVVGAGWLQLETWLYFDSAKLDQTAAVGVGALEWLELGLAAMQGLERGDEPHYGFRAPLVQIKALAREPDAWPGVALAAGVGTPFGRGHLEPPGWAGYGYSAFTQSVIDERLSLHLNTAVLVIDEGERARWGWAGGAAIEVALVRDRLSSFVEIYRGDPYDARSQVLVAHGGLAWSPDGTSQLDATLGLEFLPDQSVNRFATLGLKIVADCR